MRCYDNCPKVQSWQDEAVRFLATEECEYWCKILQTTLVATRAVGTLGGDKQRSEPSCQSYFASACNIVLHVLWKLPELHSTGETKRLP